MRGAKSAVDEAMSLRPVLLFGRFQRDELAAMTEAADQAACSLTHVESEEQARSWLENHDAVAVLCHAETSEELAVYTRSRAKHAKLPILALSQGVTSLDFAAAFSWGADDVSPFLPTRPLVTRLRALPKNLSLPPEEKRGEALVAEPEHTRRVVVGRVLRNAGYSIRFAVSPEDAQHFASDPSLKLVVANSEFMTDTCAVISEARAQGSMASFVVCTAPREIANLRNALAGLTSVTVADGYASPENVLFVANELTSGRTNGRNSQRIPYGVSVAFRGAGREVDEHGYTYNLSERGLYVRTLALPDEDEVWLELTPPRVDRLVRLVGKVAWRRPFNHSGSATVPPGFGIEIIDGAARDRALWAESYNELARAIG